MLGERAWAQAGAIAAMRGNSAQLRALGYQDAFQWARGSLGIDRRTARDLLRLHDWREGLGRLTGEQEERLMSLPPTKCRELVGVVRRENLDRWLDAAESTSRAKLLEAIRSGQPPPEPQEDTPGPRHFVRFACELTDWQDFVVTNAIGRVNASRGSLARLRPSSARAAATTLLALDFLSGGVVDENWTDGRVPYLVGLAARLGCCVAASDEHGEFLVGTGLFGKGSDILVSARTPGLESERPPSLGRSLAAREVAPWHDCSPTRAAVFECSHEHRINDSGSPHHLFTLGLRAAQFAVGSKEPGRALALMAFDWLVDQEKPLAEDRWGRVGEALERLLAVDLHLVTLHREGDWLPGDEKIPADALFRRPCREPLRVRTRYVSRALQELLEQDEDGAPR